MQLPLNGTDYHYYFSKGEFHHKRKEYALAWESWMVAHGLQNGNYQVDAANAILSALLDINLDWPHSLPDQGEDLIFIVGMPRSGTTLLEQVLITHEDIYGCGERREMVNILDDALLKKDLVLEMSHLVSYQTYYRNALPKQRKYRYYIDKMPRNVLAIPLIKQIFPKCKILRTYRNRFDTCMSIYASNFSDFTPYAHRWETLNLFYDHCNRITDQFIDQVFPISFETLILEFENSVQRLFDYLAIPVLGIESQFYQNKTEVKTCSKDQVRRPLNQEGLTQWQPYREFVFGKPTER